MNKPRKICFITGTRADYGIMSRLMRVIDNDPRAELQIIATNMHLSPEFGLTVNEIVADGLTVDKKVEMLLSSDTPTGVVKSMGLASIGFADALEEMMPDLIVILGDRYEMLAAASAANIFGIPVAHLHGGEITEGAYDDAIRHAITKLSYLHFTSTEEYRNRVIQLGEDPSRVFRTGALGAENIAATKVMPLEEFEKSIDFPVGDNFILTTYHPVTKQPSQAESQIDSLLNALERFIDRHNVLFTLPNSDNGGKIITEKIGRWVSRHKDKALALASLGRVRYYSALAHCAAVVGNSSSGLIEAPSFNVPTLNIGPRQKGRTQGNTVTDCSVDEADIMRGLEHVLSTETRSFVRKNAVNPYYKENTLEEIHRLLIDTPLTRPMVKSFYDLQ